MIRPIALFALACAAPLTAATVDIFASANAQLQESLPNTNIAPAVTLLVGHYIFDQEYTAIYRFDLTAIAPGSIVTAADLWLYDTSWNDGGTERIYRTGNNAWDPSTVTWNSYNMSGNTLLSSRTGRTGWSYNSWGIDLNAWDWAADLAAGVTTFQLRVDYEGGGYNFNEYDSISGANHPYLAISYDARGPGSVPEPAAWTLMGAGLLFLALRRRV